MILIIYVLFSITMKFLGLMLINFDTFGILWMFKFVAVSQMNEQVRKDFYLYCQERNETLERWFFATPYFDYYIFPFTIVLLVCYHYYSDKYMIAIVYTVFCFYCYFLVVFYHAILQWINLYIKNDIGSKLESYYKYNHNQDNNSDECSICWSNMSSDDLILFECSHVICFECQRRRSKQKICPICRQTTHVISTWTLGLAQKYFNQYELVRGKFRCMKPWYHIYLFYLYFKYSVASMNKRVGRQDTNSEKVTFLQA